MTITNNPYKKQRRNVQGDKMPSEISFVRRAQGEAIDNEEEEEWIMEGYASKYEWALGTGLIDFEDYADEGYPTPPREDDEQPDDKDGREKGGEKTQKEEGEEERMKEEEKGGEDEGLLCNMTKKRYNELENDPTNWSFIPLNDEHSIFGSIYTADLDMDRKLVRRERERKMGVLALANRMFRYHMATVALIKKHAPAYSPNVYIRQELFAEKILNLAFRINMSPLPVHIMSASAIKDSFGIKCMELAEFVEKMGFYDESYVVYEKKEPTHDIRSIIVVHKSLKLEKSFKAFYRWTKHIRHEEE